MSINKDLLLHIKDVMDVADNVTDEDFATSVRAIVDACIELQREADRLQLRYDAVSTHYITLENRLADLEGKLRRHVTTMGAHNIQSPRPGKPGHTWRDSNESHRHTTLPHRRQQSPVVRKV